MDIPDDQKSLMDLAAEKRAEDRVASRTEAGRDDLRFAKALTEYGVHLANCSYESWNKRLTRCKCGLFALIKDAHAALGEAHRGD